ncbi:MAG: tRNA uridine-5-carboxymethylaminomethyl(34) synthesis GTPase MnmE [Desulfobacteraceae bacterium]|nr:tRNA uridine-5-carboxymethylaminomethyl(34) synthesis GTPase MnmE [Desulfobacteraceae bacterium]
MSPEAMDRTTIGAIATPEGFGGIGVIKLSGPEAVNIACSMFRRGGPGTDNRFGACSEESLENWRLYYGYIFDPEGGRVFDEVLLAVMRAPYSYTREDVVEIQAHAGPKVLNKILELLISKGIRPAQPGEFTRRAFINGRIDLTQAEAVADLINASSDAAVDMAVSQIAGGLNSFLVPIRDALMSVLGTIEAAVDFPEAIGDEIDASGLTRSLSAKVIEPLQELINSYETGRYLRGGLRVTIVGGPNVGKSSLLNCLVNSERAIVTDVPGTTRDCIEASLIAKGFSLVLADTAGLRKDPDAVERLGIKKTREYIGSADIILFVVDAGHSVGHEDLCIFDELPRDRRIVVVNKSDLPEEQKKFQLSPEWNAFPCVFVSALYGHGMSELLDALTGMASASASGVNPEFVPNWRQKTLLDKMHRSVSQAVSALERPHSLELASIDLREAVYALDEITGRYVSADVLDRIFDSYCVGK